MSKKIELTLEEQEEAKKLIDKIFVLFNDWMCSFDKLAKTLKRKNETINFDEIIEKSKKFKFNETLGDYTS